MNNDFGAADGSSGPFAGPALLRTAPSTDPQREIWTATRLGREASLAFNESVSLRLEGELDVPALSASLSDLVARHEALRTTFTPDGLTLCVTDAGAPEWAVLDWSSASDPAALFRELVAREVEEPFDLEQGPLFRVRLARFGTLEHRLVFTAHHIVCDGWSSAVLVKDLAAFYSARRRGVPAQLPPAEAFSTYARSQRGQGHNAQRTADERYWVEQFAGEIPVLDLPTDRPRPPLKTYRSQREDSTLDGELVQRLRRVAAKERGSLFALLLAGWQAILHRLSGQVDIVVGIPTAGQAAAGKHELVGHCVSLLPLRNRPRGAQPFRELLVQARTGVLDALEHQQLTYGALLQKLPLTRDPSRLPLVSVLFNLDKGLTPAMMAFEGLRAGLSTNPRHFENSDLFLNAVELEHGVALECQYNADLFDAATVRRWLAAYERLLRAAADDPGCELGALPILSDVERELLRGWNQTDSPFPRDACVHQLIEAQVAHTPEGVAVELDGRSLSYRELNARANQLARRLRALGVRQDSLVGLCVERSIEMVVALFGILKAGGAYVPLDPGYPPERLAFMVEDSGMQLLVTESRLRGSLGLPATAQVVCLDDAEVLHESDAPLDPARFTPESAAYVIYTSGSTGKPKGVVVPHRSVVNLIASVQRRPGMTARDVVLAVTTLSFDIAVSEIILPLTVGARIVLATREVVQDGARLLQLLRESKATFLDATPATWRLLLAAGWEGGEGLKAICTGEALPKDLAIELLPRVASLWNGYGPTETTVWSSFHEVGAPVERILIGKPIANTQIHILDGRGQLAPIGVPGELYIGGAGVTRGYLNRPELTSERFVSDPFRSDPSARMYRTGDVARWLPDGNLDYLGRNDNQVKLRGYRIELGEIEHALSRHPGVAQAAALVREDRPGDKRLVAYVVARPGSSPGEADLRTFLKGVLPEYMAPAMFLPLAALPLTPSGKVDKKALPAPKQPESDAATFVAPRPGAEAMVAAAFEEALGVARIGTRDDFFALGGHSLLASQVLARLRRDHGITISFRALFEAPTVERLAAFIETEGLLKSPTMAAAIPRHTGPQQLSLMQERLWLLEEMDERQRAVHSLPAAWRLRGPLDVDVLERSLREIVRRHQTLRTSLRLDGSVPTVQVAEDAQLTLERRDLLGAPESEREEALLQLLDQEARHTIDLSRAPLLRAFLVRLGNLDHALFILPHNLVWDGWSFDIFLRELGLLYAALSAGATSPLQPLPISYGDFAAWQRGWLASPEAERQRLWWLDRLAGASPLELHTDRARDASTGLDAGNAGVLLPREQADALTALAREQGATLFMVLFSAFNVLLHRYTGQTDLLVGTPLRARTQAETEDLIGPFINALALRTRLSPSWTFAELVAYVREQTLDAFSHQELPFEALGTHAPAVRAFFSLQDARARPLQLGGLSVTQIHVHPTGAANDVTLWMMESARGLFAMLNYRRDLFEAPMMERLLGHYRTLLAAVVADPRRPISQLPLSPPEESAAVARWSMPEGSPAALAHRLVEHAVLHAPGAVALRRGEESLQAGELWERAGRLAGRLRERGAGPGARVALLLPQGLERAVAVLATLRSGAAVLPLDPDHPPARLAVLLSDAAPAVVVTNSRLRERALADAPVLLLDSEPSGNASLAGGPVPAPDAPACVVYQAIGAAAGALLSHQLLAATMEAAKEQLGLAPGDVLLAVAPLSTDGALLELLLPLGAGAAVAFANPAAVLDGAALRDELARAGATTLAAPAPAWARLLAAGWHGGASFKAICTGSPPSAELAAALAARAGAAFSAYGSTEGGIWSFLERLDPHGGRVTLGRPLPGHSVAVVDRYGQPAPVGVPGSLQMGASRRGERARWLPDGRIELLAGTPGVVELRGLRAGLAEIEAALRSDPAVAEAAVIAGADRFGSTRLAACLVKRPGQSRTDTEIRQHLRRTLPEACLPQLFLEVELLARGADGELDRRTLPDPFAPAGEETPSPRTDAERLVAALWREALGVARIGVHDNFFDLGGTSLLCFHVVAGVEKATGLRLSPRVFLLDTLEQAARRIADGAQARQLSGRAPSAPSPAGSGT